MLATGLALALSGCGGGSGGGSSTPAAGTLSGVAAVGSPLVNATIKVNCAAGSALTDTNNTTGAWQVTLSGLTLPCAVQVSAGTINGIANTNSYHSIAMTPGIVNVTPLTDLIVASLASVATPGTWFAGLNTTPAPLAAITQANVDASLGKVRTALSTLTPLGTNNPITMPLTASPGTVGDDMLAAFKTALSNAGVNYASLLTEASKSTFAAPAGLDTQLTNAYHGTVSGGSSRLSAIPDGVTATSSSSTQINVNWTNISGATSYNIYRSTSANVQVAAGNKINTTTVMSGPFQNTGLAASTSYFYKVTAVNASGETAGSSEVTATTSAAGVTTPMVTGFSPATGAIGTTITITGTNIGNFTPAPVVKFGTITATVSAATGTSITVTVPAGLAVGNSTITVSNFDGTGVMTVGTFNVTAAGGTAGGTMTVQAITGSNTPGSQLIIVMSGMTSTTASSYRVVFGGNVATTASLVSTANGILYVTIPSGAVTGPIMITDQGTGATATSTSFTVVTPTIVAACTAMNNGVSTTLPASGVVGVNWSDCSMQSPGNVKIAWGNNEFVGFTKSSTDGYTWAANNNPFSRVAFNGTRWVSARTNWSTTQIAYSANSSSTSAWTTINVPLGSPGLLMDIFAVNGRFFVSTNNGTFLTSTDGINWTETSGLCGQGYLSPVYAGNVSRVLWHNSKYLTYVGNPANFQQQFACTSTDGVTWTSTVLSFSTGATAAFVPTAYASNGTQLVTTHFSSLYGNEIWTSTDGVAWIKATSVAPLNAKDMIWTGSQYIALGAGIATSPDGLIWTAQTSGAAASIANISMNNLAYSPTLNRVLMTGWITSSQNALFVSP